MHEYLIFYFHRDAVPSGLERDLLGQTSEKKTNLSRKIRENLDNNVLNPFYDKLERVFEL